MESITVSFCISNLIAWWLERVVCEVMENLPPTFEGSLGPASKLPLAKSAMMHPLELLLKLPSLFLPDLPPQHLSDLLYQDISKSPSREN